MAFPTLTLAGAGAEGAVTATTGTGAGVLVGTTDMPKSTSAFVFPLAASAFFVESPTPSNAEEAIEVWKEYQKGTLNGIPSIGIQIHKPGQPEVEDMQVDLVSGKTMDLDMLRYYSEINVEETAIQKICELVENLQDVEIVGKIPENISAERIMRGFDPKGEIYNEE